MELAYTHLLGRPYVPGKVHCYALVRDFVADNFDMHMANYAIPHDWDADKLDLIGMIYEREGWEKVENWSIRSLRPADILCVSVRSSNANHLVINLGGNQLLHHPVNEFSRVEPMRDFWRMSTGYVLRHPSIPNLTPVQQTATIQELLDERYRVQAEA